MFRALLFAVLPLDVVKKSLVKKVPIPKEARGKMRLGFGYCQENICAYLGTQAHRIVSLVDELSPSSKNQSR